MITDKQFSLVKPAAPEVKSRRLFGLAGDLEDILGRSLALRLIGGCWRFDPVALRWRAALYVPKVLPVGHHLETLLGRDPAQRLVAAFGGMVLQPPRCAEITRAALARGILELRAHGLRHKDIIFLCDCSPRHVRTVLAGA